MSKSGGCQCGQVRYEVTGEPMNQLFCYCSGCQSLAGGDKWFGIWYSPDNLTFTGKETKTYTRKGSSGNDVHVHYCPDCGSTICLNITVGNFFSIAAPSFDSSESFAPKLAMFVESAPKWATLPTDIPVFDTYPPQFRL